MRYIKSVAPVKRPTSYRLSREAKRALVIIAKHHGITKSAALEMLLRDEARAVRGLTPKPTNGQQ